MDESIPEDAPKPRLCHLRKWPDFSGYGFNLHAERGKAGQFIGTVDADSPALAADLRPGDRIIEVNGTNIGSENHQQVVQRIKAVADETRLLVVDTEADIYYKERKLIVRGDMDNVDVHVTPAVNPYTTPTTDDDISAPVNDMKLSDDNGDDAVVATETDSNTPAASNTSLAGSAGDDGADDENYVVRLCHLKIWPDFVGYGFNLHADRATPGQYIGKVDDGSPAEAAGLRLDDRIIEVNGRSVQGRSHAEVVTEIKLIQGEVRLLVVDAASDQHYRNRGIEISSTSIHNIQTLTCPDHNPAQNVTVNGDEELPPVAAEVRTDEVEEEDDQPVSTYEAATAAAADNEYDNEPHAYASENDDEQPKDSDVAESVSAEITSSSSSSATPVVAESAAAAGASSNAPAQATSQSVVVGGIEFAGSAKEARERMKKKKGKDSNLSLRDKYNLLQAL